MGTKRRAGGAPRAIFADNGRIAERGSHDELLGKGRVYKELWTAQAEYYKDTAGGLYAKIKQSVFFALLSVYFNYFLNSFIMSPSQ